MSFLSFSVITSPPKSVSGRFRPLREAKVPLFNTFNLIAVLDRISTTSVFTLPSKINTGSPTLTFSAKLYCTGRFAEPSCCSIAWSNTISSPSATSKRLSTKSPKRIFGPCKSCKIATCLPRRAEISRIFAIFAPCSS